MPAPFFLEQCPIIVFIGSSNDLRQAADEAPLDSPEWDRQWAEAWRNHLADTQPVPTACPECL